MNHAVPARACACVLSLPCANAMVCFLKSPLPPRPHICARALVHAGHLATRARADLADALPPQPSSAVSVTSASRRRPSASYSRGVCPPKLKLSHKERQILEQGTFPPIRVLPTLAVRAAATAQCLRLREWCLVIVVHVFVSVDAVTGLAYGGDFDSYGQDSYRMAEVREPPQKPGASSKQGWQHTVCSDDNCLSCLARWGPSAPR